MLLHVWLGLRADISAQGSQPRIRMAAGQHVVEGALGGLVPVPGVLERLDLRPRLLEGRALNRTLSLAWLSKDGSG